MSTSEQSYEIEIFINGDKENDELVNTYYADSIIRMELTESVLTLLPKIELSFADGGVALDRNPILDKDVVHVRLNSIMDLPETEIIATFIISSFMSVSTPQNDGNIISLSGYMACENMFSPYKRVSYSGSSSDTLSTLVRNAGLKFNSNTDGVESCFWYQNGNTYSFMNHVAERSYIPNDGVFVYGGLSGTINYMSYRNVAALDVAFTAIYNNNKMQEEALLPEDKDKMFYDNYDILNMAEVYNNASNYGGVWTHYNLEEYIDTPITLLDATTDLKNMKESYYDIPVFSDSVGIIGEESLQNTIYRGKVQNNFAKFQLFSNSISLNIRDLTNVTLFDKVFLQIQSNINEDEIVESYSGEYLVTSISHSIVKGANPGYTKRVLLCRNGINKSDTRQNYEGIV